MPGLLLSQNQQPLFLKHLALDSTSVFEIAEAQYGLNKLFRLQGELPAKYMHDVPTTLIWSNSGLLMLPDGTGRVYQI